MAIALNELDRREWDDLLLLVDNFKDPAETLQLADKYLIMMNEMGDKFRLPREHIHLAPMVNFFGPNQDVWLHFLREVRDQTPIRSDRYAKIHTVFRRADTRIRSLSRRARLANALRTAIAKGLVEDETQAKRDYERRCTQVWLKRKTNLLIEHRSEAPGGRLSNDEQRRVLDTFWRQIDAELEHGEVPNP